MVKMRFSFDEMPVAFRKDLCKLFLFLAVAISFSSLLSAQYINFDDAEHFMNNASVTNHSFSVLFQMFFPREFVLRTYIPLTILSINIEHFFFGFNSYISHAINISLHLVLVFLVFRLGKALGLSLLASFLAAMVFGVHPIHVESVGWVTERKDVLYGVLYVAALLHYVHFLKKGKARAYILTLIFACLSILAKPMALSFPLILCLVDWLLKRPFHFKSVLQKVPFFFIAGLVALITFVQNSRFHDVSWPESFILWFWCASFYIEKFFWPTDLSSFYMIPVPVMKNLFFYLKGHIILVLVALFSFKFRTSRWLLFGAFFYVLSAFFLWRVDGADPSFVADRFMYLPSLGFCLFVGWIAALLFERFRGKARMVWGIFLCVGFVLLMVLAYRHSLVWNSSWNLWNRSLVLYPKHTASYFGRLTAVLSQDQRSVKEFRKYVYEKKLSRPCRQPCPAVEKRWDYFVFLMGRSDLEKAYAMNPFPGYLDASASLYWMIHDGKRADALWERIISLDYTAASPYYNRAIVAFNNGDYDKVIKFTSEYMLKMGDQASLRSYILQSVAHFKKGDRVKSWELLQKAQKFYPCNPELSAAITYFLNGGKEDVSFSVTPPQGMSLPGR